MSDPKQFTKDPNIGPDHVLVRPSMVAQRLARGFVVVEDNVQGGEGEQMVLMKKVDSDAKPN